MILHGSHNLFVQYVFDPFTTDTEVTRYVTGEFGAGSSTPLPHGAKR